MARSSARALRRAPAPSPTAGIVRVLGQYRRELAAAGVLALILAGFAAWPLLANRPEPLPAGVAPMTAGRMAFPTYVPVTRAPVDVNAQPTYQPSILRETDVIDIVATRRINGVDFTTMRQRLAVWSASYRGDGTWLVRGDDASWLVFEQSRGVLPANQAAINLEAPAGRRVAR